MEPTCNVCGQGTLKKRKKHRLGIPLAVFGYAALVFAILAFLFAAPVLRASFAAHELKLLMISNADLASLDDGSRNVATAKIRTLSICGGLFAASLVIGPLGLLLTMRKKVLQCTDCGAVVAAS